ncbi:tatD related DNase domain-containing protein [Sarocladium implicatum]|nr:tatD related DNase domain-containing protein [Sarocladium implicatum]
MSSIPLINSKMRASALTVMATRSQDQQLVADVAEDLAVQTKDDFVTARNSQRAVIFPAYGWHPWFSHHIYDDAGNSNQDGELDDEAKAKHYRSVLTPEPDDAFIASLPKPTRLSSLLSSTSAKLCTNSHALIGEIGLDKAFRLPSAPSPDDPPSDPSLTPGGRQGRLLSPYRVKPEHQRSILEAQLRLAGKEGRAVSVHGVQAHGLLLETAARCWKGHEKKVISRRQQKLDAHNRDWSSDGSSEDDEPPKPKQKEEPQKSPEPKAYPPRICLHSFSAAEEVLHQWLNPAIPATIFFSFSVAVNASTDTAREKLKGVIKEVPEDKILVESDLHVAGEEMDKALENMYRFVCEVKGWALEDGVERIARNYEAFIFG